MIAGALRACRPTMVVSERWRARAAISSASARFLPSGHSQRTGLPASSPAMTSSRWPGTRTQTTTRSTSEAAAMSPNRWKPRAAPNAAAEAFAVSSCAVQTAWSWYWGRTFRAGTWALAPQPLPPCVTVAPTIPTRILSGIGVSLADCRSEDDEQPTSGPAGRHLALRLRRLLGRERLRHAQREPLLGDEAPEALERLVIVQVRHHSHRLDRDASFRRASETAHGGELAALANRWQDRGVEHSRVDQPVDAAWRRVMQGADRCLAAGHHRLRPETLHQRRVRRPRHGDHAQSVGDTELDRVTTDGAGGTGDTEGLTRPEREPIEREADREPVHREGGGGLQARTFGHASHGRCRDGHQLRLGATAGTARVDDRHYALAGAKGHAIADAVDDAGQLHARDKGRSDAHLGQLVDRELPPAAEADVGRVDRRRRDTNPHLAAARSRLRQLRHLQHLGAAQPEEGHGAHVSTVRRACGGPSSRPFPGRF